MEGQEFIQKDFTLYYSDLHRQGKHNVCFMINSKTHGSIMSFTHVNEKIYKLRIKGKFHNITFINTYAPTEDADELITEQFYDRLQQKCDNIPRHECIIIFGDANAKLGKEELFQDVIGEHSLHDEINENGKRLVHLATLNNLRITSTCFPHKNIHKVRGLYQERHNISK